jgi:hypothetical protein
MRPAVLAGAIALAWSISVAHAQAPPAGPERWTFGPSTCTRWTDAEQGAAGVAAAMGRSTAEPVGVVVHLMIATDPVRPPAPIDDLVAGWPDPWKNPATGERKVWTPAEMRMFLGPDGLVNERWAPTIQLRLARIEDCEYTAGLIRLDDLARDSMFTPAKRVPWATQLFRSLNQIFIDRDPRRLHLLIWWTLDEGELGRGGVPGYGRAAARGGPAGWISTEDCLRPSAPPRPGQPPPPAPRRPTDTDQNCGKLIAHEVGHALSLHHVSRADVAPGAEPKKNLMHRDFQGQTLEDWQRERARAEARRRFRNP